VKTERLTFESRIPASPRALYDWHAEPEALERLTPPWESVEVLEKTGGLEDGARVVLRVGKGLLARRWVAEHRDHVEGERFTDVMVEGPFRSWKHVHRFLPDGEGGAILVDDLEFALPFGLPGRWLLGRFLRQKIRRMFEWRHRVTREAFGEA
jgi:ligand-binding SRPBCC domain-containing protein